MIVRLGILLPQDILEHPAVAVLAAFVAINTLLYVALAIAQLLPRLYLSDLFRGRNRRAETRSIYPDGPI